MIQECNRHIRETLDLARQLTVLADHGETDSRDDGCAVLYGVVRDCAYKIRGQAELEKERHKLRGMWTNGDA
jgi:hypothetical protein